jgi:hypothetical protein
MNFGELKHPCDNEALKLIKHVLITAVGDHEDCCHPFRTISLPSLSDPEPGLQVLHGSQRL